MKFIKLCFNCDDLKSLSISLYFAVDNVLKKKRGLFKKKNKNRSQDESSIDTLDANYLQSTQRRISQEFLTLPSSKVG